MTSIITMIPRPQEFREDFTEYSDPDSSSHHVGLLGDSLQPILVWSPVQSGDNSMKWTLNSIKDCVYLPNYYTWSIFNSSDLFQLTDLYSKLYSVPPSAVSVNSSFCKYASLSICSKVVGGYKSRSSASSLVMISWIPKYFGQSPGVASEASTDLDIRPARITFFAKHPIRVHGNLHTHLLACISWLKRHSDQAALGNLKPMTIWEYDII